uniref:Kazal-like domain-containing protein n=1 Tax=Bos indicus x Bos taurus TaxID=30522 RepID=A0A4W2F631_BOBOX
MQRGLVQVQPEVAQAPEQVQSQAEQGAPSKSTGPPAAEAEKAGPKRPHLRIFPVSLLKLGAFSKQGGGQTGATRRGAKTGLGHRKGSLEGPCGWSCLVFPWCQRFNNVRCFLIFFCILVTAQCVVFGLVDLSTDSFKKENNLSIIENIFLSLTYDISSCLVVVFIAYYGGKGNIPRWITVSSFLVGSGSLLFAFPYFSVEDSQMNVEFEGIVEAVGILGYSLGYTIGAPLIKVSVIGQLGNLTAPCNSHCKCSSAFYSATCGRNDIGYFSPCFAGCTQSKTLKASKTYYNCSCIKEGLTTSDDQGDFIDATKGTCDPKCYKLPLFIAFIFATIVFSAFAGVPSILTILRIVSDKQRPLAMGMTFVILRICGTLPGPVIFKIIRETSCIFRDTERCGSTGNCWIYYKTKMAYLLVAVCFTCKVATIFFNAVALSLYRNLPQENSDVLATVVKNPRVKKNEREESTLCKNYTIVNLSMGYYWILIKFKII